MKTLHRDSTRWSWDDKTTATSEAGHWTVSVDMRYEGGWGLEVEASQTDRQEAAQSKSHLRCWSHLPERETWKRPENPPAHIQILGVLPGLNGLGQLRLVGRGRVVAARLCLVVYGVFRRRNDLSDVQFGCAARGSRCGGCARMCRCAAGLLAPRSSEARGGETSRDDVWDVKLGSRVHEAWRIFARESVSVEVLATNGRAVP